MTATKDSVQTSNTSAEWHWDGEAWDRRSSTRLALSYPLRLRRPGVAREFEGQTNSVSHSGFYFQSAVPFRPQERVEYEMAMEWPGSHGTTQVEVLHGFARVVRVDPARPEGKFGIACRLEGEYTVSRRDQESTSIARDLPVRAEAC